MSKNQKSPIIRKSLVELAEELGIPYQKLAYQIKKLSKVKNSGVVKIPTCYDIPKHLIEIFLKKFKK